ncbi:MAG: V-type ATP synthase subunit F [Nitrospirae bacterium]|nr:V-type ATP synthase subunit F [Nitrospirota bacterium]
MRIIGVMDPDTALGFRLTGMDVKEVRSSGEAAKYLSDLLSEKGVGLVLYSEAYHGLLPEPILRQLERSECPIYIPIPTMETWKERDRARTYIAGLLRRAVGYQIRFSR